MEETEVEKRMRMSCEEEEFNLSVSLSPATQPRSCEIHIKWYKERGSFWFHLKSQ